MGTETLALFLRDLPRQMSEKEVHAAERERDAERGVLVVTPQHAEYGAGAH